MSSLRHLFGMTALVLGSASIALTLSLVLDRRFSNAVASILVALGLLVVGFLTVEDPRHRRRSRSRPNPMDLIRDANEEWPPDDRGPSGPVR